MSEDEEPKRGRGRPKTPIVAPEPATGPDGEPAKRGRGRPPSPPDKRLVRVAGYVTISEQDEAYAIAKREGLSPGQWIAELVRREIRKARAKG